ncbi:hypothetical protein [Neoaquamicrobium sediminum]|uniref:hypothetical protein n=1 Tax=Neoaquamicrobium sediminum TaxID=1849104 RepID=UPI004036BC65
MMLLPPDDYTKRRLTEPAELTVAAEFLIARGFGSDEIAVQLSRFYYVDIDALNDVVSNMSDHGRKAQWRHVS